MAGNRLSVPFDAGSSRQVAFTLRNKPAEGARFVLSLRNSGGETIETLIRALVTDDDVPVIDVPDRLGQNGIDTADWFSDPGLLELFWPGNIYVGFREPPVCLLQDAVFAAARKILVVRDPRDAMSDDVVGEFLRREIAVPGSTDQDADRIRSLHEEVARTYLPLLSDPNLLLIRYESFAKNVKAILPNILEHFSLEKPGWRTLRRLAKEARTISEASPADRFLIDRLPTGSTHLGRSNNGAQSVSGFRYSSIWQHFGYQIDGE